MPARPVRGIHQVRQGQAEGKTFVDAVRRSRRGNELSVHSRGGQGTTDGKGGNKDAQGRVVLVYQRSSGIFIASAISSAMCLTPVETPRRWHMPEIFIVQPASLQMTVSAPVAAMQPTLSSTIAPLMAGYLM